MYNSLYEYMVNWITLQFLAMFVKLFFFLRDFEFLMDFMTQERKKLNITCAI